MSITSLKKPWRAALALASAIVAAPQLASAACIGDCNSYTMVTVDELVVGINIAFGASEVSACGPMDDDGNSMVTVDELVRAVNMVLMGCPIEPTATPSETVAPSSTPSETPLAPSPTAAATATSTPEQQVAFCDLPGSVRFLEDGVEVVPGAPTGTPDLTWVQGPTGFCVHYYAKVPKVRGLRFAPGGELFAASASRATAGGGPAGSGAILVLPDDDQDGFADSQAPFLTGIPATSGMMFANGSFYYQNDTRILRMPYAAGDRVPSAESEQIADITIHVDGLHWQKVMDIADDGTIYVTNGGAQTDPCEQPVQRFRGGVLELDGSPSGTVVATGFRNAISLRCARGHNLCFVIELGKDGTAFAGGREKLVPFRQSGNWGFPCCATKNVPFPGIIPIPDCSEVMDEKAAFLIGDTPFDLDFETGKWPEPWNNRVYVPLHGAVGTWFGARIVGIAMDPLTGDVLPGSSTGNGMSTGAMVDFAEGWDDGTRMHGRPANVAFAPDGRLFMGNDFNGDIIWFAPIGMTAGDAGASD
jgi:glucose/arabinose dehydrogenase